MKKNASIILDESLVRKIYFIPTCGLPSSPSAGKRGQKVMLDRDLAELYGVETKVLNQAVKRNLERFPIDFMFQITKVEFENWRSQIVTSNSDKMGLRYAPFCFTEQGVAIRQLVRVPITIGTRTSLKRLESTIFPSIISKIVT